MVRKSALIAILLCTPACFLFGAELPCRVDADCPNDEHCGAAKACAPGVEGEGEGVAGEGEGVAGEGEGVAGEGEGVAAEGEGVAGEGEGVAGEGEGAAGEGEGEGAPSDPGTCGNPFAAFAGDANVGDTSDNVEPDEVAPTCSGNPTAPEDVWEVTVTEPSRVDITFHSAFDQTLSIHRNQCGNTERGCVGPEGVVTVNVAAGERVIVVVTPETQSGAYSFSVVVTPTCGDGSFDRGEQCDDGNNVDGDLCSALCRFEFTLEELEPNDDGVATPGSALVNNGFDDPARANADGQFGVPITTNQVIFGRIDVSGDEDVYAFQDATGIGGNVVVTTVAPSVGCVDITEGGTVVTDTLITSYDETGVFLGQNDDDDTHNGQVPPDSCSRLVIPIPANGKVYADVSAFDDVKLIPTYLLVVQFE